MHDATAVLKQLYDRFNCRDIDGVLAALADDVVWANGMDGGHVVGHAAVRAYWTRQWSVVSPHVAPVAFREAPDGVVIAEVRQTVLDLDGNPLEGQAHGLKDRTVEHVFHFNAGRIVRFDIAEAL